jgi:hypothetical protein
MLPVKSAAGPIAADHAWSIRPVLRDNAGVRPEIAGLGIRNFHKDIPSPTGTCA